MKIESYLDYKTILAPFNPRRRLYLLLRHLAAPTRRRKGAVHTIDTERGTKYRIRATFTGLHGCRLRMVTIWMNEKATGTTKFVTLFPDKS